MNADLIHSHNSTHHGNLSHVDCPLCQVELLKMYGFKWHKEATTDTVAVEDISDIYPAAHGFTIAYTLDCAIKYSTAKVTKIDIPENLDAEWIVVHWETIVDERW